MTTGFNQLGFLSQDQDQWRVDVRREFSQPFILADKLNALAMRMLFSINTEDNSAAHIVALAAFGRAVEAFQSAVLLVERGALLDAKALVRGCTEAVITCGALLRAPETYDLFCSDWAKHQLSLGNEVLAKLATEV